jgi:hypothetical protein
VPLIAVNADGAGLPSLENAMRGPIQLRLETIQQLFSSLDPFPFRERDLDKDAEEFIVDWARELKDKTPPGIVILLPPAALAEVNEAEIGEAIRRYFSYRAELAASDLKALFRLGRRSLFIGIAVLVLCFTAQGAIAPYTAGLPAGRFLEEGLIILGWVANWKPLEIFLFDWWPLADRRALLARLGRAQISVRGSDGAGV